MNKGKSKSTGKKYLSIVLIPHSSSHVKVLKFSSFYVKLAICLSLAGAVLVGGGICLSRVLGENRALKQNIGELCNANSEQHKLLEQKNEELKRLKNENTEYSKSVDARIKEFTDSYNKLTDDYIKGSSKTNRSGDRSAISFSGEISTLKKALDSLGQLYSHSNSSTADLSDAEAKLAKYLDTIPTLWPAKGDITDRFGYRRDPFTRRTKYHEGIDIGSDRGSSIRAAASGTVILASRTRGLGRAVKINHGRGIVTLYGHASKLLVKEGQKVKKGDIIARVGSSGRSTGPHLHFEILLYGTPVDPLKYLGS
jgi:murein DD-endopeptidase MepM/ murein hydrolase activator NlpD